MGYPRSQKRTSSIDKSRTARRLPVGTKARPLRLNVTQCIAFLSAPLLFCSAFAYSAAYIPVLDGWPPPRRRRWSAERSVAPSSPLISGRRVSSSSAAAPYARQLGERAASHLRVAGPCSVPSGRALENVQDAPAWSM